MFIVYYFKQCAIFALNNINSMEKKENRGGARAGAGRKPAPYKTKTISFRVREELVTAVREAVKRIIEMSSPT